MDKKEQTKNYIKDILPYIFIILTVVLIRSFIVTPIVVNGTSMSKTLDDGDTMILNKIGLKLSDIKRFQIVVIKTSDSYLIKRVIGLPGEYIKYEITEDEFGKETAKLLINGKYVSEDFISDDTKLLTCKNDTSICTEGITIPKGYYFVMGDNRGNSMDSRIIGFINKKDILGTTKLVIFPLNNIGIVE